jgi:hypothetical protein
MATCICPAAGAQTFHLQKSLTGPSGKVVGPNFVFDETRSRFLYPNEKSLIVYFEWQAPLGDHTLVASWKGPDGRTLFISPDVKIENKAPIMASYWEFLIPPNPPAGIWTCEIKIDGEPAGSESFELEVTKAEATPRGPEKPKHPSTDQVYSLVSQSLVWVYALDKDGSRLDSSDGFVYAGNIIATSFDAIDSAAGLELEFSDGRKIKTDQVAACSRLQNWALIKADSAKIPAIKAGDSNAVKVGEGLTIFNVGPNHARQFGKVDVTGRQPAGNSGARILFSADVSPESSGGPLLDVDGHVVGILGVSPTPGARLHHKNTTSNAGLFDNLNFLSGAVPLSALTPGLPDSSQSLAELMDNKTLTRPLFPSLSFLWGTTSAGQVSKKTAGQGAPTLSEFRANQSVTVETMWQKREKSSKGLLAGEVFDASNHLRVNIAPKKISLVEQTPSKFLFSFPIANLEPGTYRVDVLWNDAAVWRTFFTVVE